MPPVLIGSTLLHYEITAKLGEGGMGEVYRAEDGKLGREVAIKVLPEAFVTDPERLARFEHEARVHASLDHLNVASIYGIEQADGVRFLVMQLVPGEDLSERLARGPVPVDEAIGIARQIADGLESAHERSIVHRDLKPANVKLDDEGNVKILDFGLAKALEPEGTDGDFTRSPTMTMAYAATQRGVILGTAAYMSPEQARGKAVDKRADIWAFGVIFWEMLSGERLFAGETLSDTLAAVLTSTPDRSKLPPETPRSVRRVLERCLDGDPRTRLRDVGEARIALDRAAEGDPTAEDPEPKVGAEAGRRPTRSLGIGVLAGVVVGVLAALGAARLLPGDEPVDPPAPVRFGIDVGESVDVNGLAISPDGRSVAWSFFDGDDAVWVRRLDQLEPRRIELPWDADMEGWTPDGRSLVLHRRTTGNGELWKLPLDGGRPTAIGTLPVEGFLWGVAPGDDGEILVGMADAGIFSLAVGGGTPKQVVAPEGGEGLTGPCWVPDRRALLFSNIDEGRIEAVVDGERRIVLERPGDRIFDPLVAPSGHLLFRLSSGQSASGIWAVPFSVDRLEASGEPFQILPYGLASISTTGTIAFRPSRSRAVPAQLVEVDRSGEILATIGEPLPGLRSPALSPDGSLVAVSASSGDAAADIFVVNRRTGAHYSLPDPVGTDWSPFWRDGGETLGFLTSSAGIRQARERSADGRDEPRLLDDETLVAALSPDGRYLITAFYEASYREPDSADETTLFQEVIIGIDFHPEGRWIAYTLLRGEGLFLRRFPEGSGLTPVVSGDADSPRFGPDGRELFYWQEDSLMAVPVDLSGDRATVGEPQELFASDPSAPFDVGWASFDVTPDGRFLMARRLEEADAPENADGPGIVILQNWASE